MARQNESPQQKVAQRKERKEKDKTSRETLGKYFYDLSKLTFTAMCLGSGVSLVMDYTATVYWILLVLGILFSAGLARVGFLIINK